MAEPVPFKPLKEFGVLALSEESEIRFYVDEWKGRRYASIRQFLKRKGYTGPTKAGVTMNAQLAEQILGALEKLPKEPDTTEDKELARFPRRAGIELVVRITIYKSTTGIDLREWVDDTTYKGWSKKGVRLPYGELADSVAYLRGMRDFLAAAS